MNQITGPDPAPPSSDAPTALFGSRVPEPAPMSAAPWLIAGLVILLAVAGLLLVTHHAPGSSARTLLPLDPYASRLSFTGLEMSESTSLSGGKSTFIDGHVHNEGDRTVTSATVQVLFHNDESMPPQMETLAVTLIRTREPYIDTQPLSAAPLAPGDGAEFRLIFEDIGPNWNQQLPEIRLVGTRLK